jgi:hypothetical protein
MLDGHLGLQANHELWRALETAADFHTLSHTPGYHSQASATRCSARETYDLAVFRILG